MTLQGLGHAPLFIPRTVSVLCMCVMWYHSHAPIYEQQWEHLYLYIRRVPTMDKCVWWCSMRTWYSRCLSYVLAKYVCIVVPVIHLVLLALAALVVCVGYMYSEVAWHVPHVKGSGPCKMQTFPIAYGVAASPAWAQRAPYA